jgi:hypothetical protein
VDYHNRTVRAGEFYFNLFYDELGGDRFVTDTDLLQSVALACRHDSIEMELVAIVFNN